GAVYVHFCEDTPSLSLPCKRRPVFFTDFHYPAVCRLRHYRSLQPIPASKKAVQFRKGDVSDLRLLFHRHYQFITIVVLPVIWNRSRQRKEGISIHPFNDNAVTVPENPVHPRTNALIHRYGRAV